MDLKTVFDIPNDDKYHLQLFNTSLLPEFKPAITQEQGEIIVDTEIREIQILEDDRKF